MAVWGKSHLSVSSVSCGDGAERVEKAAPGTGRGRLGSDTTLLLHRRSSADAGFKWEMSFWPLPSVSGSGRRGYVGKKACVERSGLRHVWC
jgi:hypothetical protein